MLPGAGHPDVEQPALLGDLSGTGGQHERQRALVHAEQRDRVPLQSFGGVQGGHGDTRRRGDVLGLRAEVENLRRVMQEIRAERFEPPPEYAG